MSRLSGDGAGMGTAQTANTAGQDALRDLAAQVVEQAVRAGASAAEALMGSGSEMSVRVREGRPELVHEAKSKNLGLRVFKDHRTSLTYTSDFSPDGLRTFIENAVALCRLAEPDPLNELPAREDLVAPDAVLPSLSLWDERTPEVDAARAIEWARACEAAAIAVSPKLRSVKTGRPASR